MDIYPMSRDAEDNVGEENSRKYFHRKPSRGKIFFIPIKSKAKFAEPMISSLISPSDKRNRLLVKLNLYPDRKKIQGNEILKRGGYVEPINRMRSDKIALPGFFRRKKKSPSGQCAILCYDPPRTSFKSRSRLQRREKNLRRKSGNDSQ